MDSDGQSTQRLRVAIARDADRIVVTLDGELDVSVASDARAHLDEAIERAVAHDVGGITVDAAGLTFCDSTGLSTLVHAADAASARGVTLSVRALSPPLRELLHITGLDGLVEP